MHEASWLDADVHRSIRQTRTFKYKAGPSAIHGVEVHCFGASNNKVSFRIQGSAVLLCTHLIQETLRSISQRSKVQAQVHPLETDVRNTYIYSTHSDHCDASAEHTFTLLATVMLKTAV